MAVIHGSKAKAFMNGYDVGDFVQSAKSSASRPALESTVLNNAGSKTYKKDNYSGGVSCSGFFDGDTPEQLVADGLVEADTGDYLLKTAIESDEAATFLHFPGGATSVGDKGIGYEGCIESYDANFENGSLADCSFNLKNNVGREHLVLLAAKATRTNTFTGTTHNYGSVQTLTGGAVYLQSFKRTSGTLPVIVEHSDDGIAWSTLATFTTVTADHKHERIAIATTIKQYVRAAATGTYVNNFLVAIHRKP